MPHPLNLLHATVTDSCYITRIDVDEGMQQARKAQHMHPIDIFVKCPPCVYSAQVCLQTGDAGKAPPHYTHYTILPR